MNEKKINQFVEDLKFHTLGGFTLEKAYEKFRKNEIENYESKFLLELDEAKNILNTKSVKSLNFSIVSSKKQEDWYFGPQEFHQNWHAYKNYLLKVKNRSKDVIDLCGGYEQLYPLAEDLHLWFKAFPHFNFANVDEVLIDYTQTKSENYDARVPMLMADTYYELFKKAGVVEGEREDLVMEWQTVPGGHKHGAD